MSDPSPKPDQFVERISAALRRPEQLDDTFEDRLVAALRPESASADHQSSDARAAQSWWRRPLTLRVTPLAGLAAAASCAAIISLATLGAVRAIRTPAAVVASMAPDTVHVVRFVYVDRNAHSVALVGDFNSWKPDQSSLAVPGENGAWTISIPLTPGRHEYAFIVDGQRWTPDPFAPHSIDEFDTRSSVINVGG
jgi:hypothetical protein